MITNHNGLLSNVLRGEAGRLFPGYFALVMATGIVSIAAYTFEMPGLALALLTLNVVAYGVLWILTSARFIRYPARAFADLADHHRGPAFFTLVAGTGVLGSQLVIVVDAFRAAWVLWWLGLALWVFITYGFFTAVTVAEVKPRLENGINGAWLIAIVATQSLSALAAVLALRSVGGDVTMLLFLALCLHFAGSLLYLIVITLIFYRFTFFRLTTAALTPSYWINMGAVAITTLAGSLLIMNASRWRLLTDILPFLQGLTLLFWASATWWIPLLLILGVWRHLYRRFPLRYDPQYWSMVFPLGMYTVCTVHLSEALGLPFLMAIPRVFVYVSILAWLAAAGGLLSKLATAGRPSLDALALAGGPSATAGDPRESRPDPDG